KLNIKIMVEVLEEINKPRQEVGTSPKIEDRAVSSMKLELEKKEDSAKDKMNTVTKELQLLYKTSGVDLSSAKAQEMVEDIRNGDSPVQKIVEMNGDADRRYKIKGVMEEVLQEDIKKLWAGKTPEQKKQGLDQVRQDIRRLSQDARKKRDEVDRYEGSKMQWLKQKLGITGGSELTMLKMESNLMSNRKEAAKEKLERMKKILEESEKALKNDPGKEDGGNIPTLTLEEMDKKDDVKTEETNQEELPKKETEEKAQPEPETENVKQEQLTIKSGESAEKRAQRLRENIRELMHDAGATHITYEDLKKRVCDLNPEQLNDLNKINLYMARHRDKNDSRRREAIRQEEKNTAFTTIQVPLIRAIAEKRRVKEKREKEK
ncbi:MAG: hypothetical protein KC736_01845, partial [Candidatus Moranbacteria bacterium]|nr:hypothetical protein [Candidatus Moranbacteria bacterium]